MGMNQYEADAVASMIESRCSGVRAWREFSGWDCWVTVDTTSTPDFKGSRGWKGQRTIESREQAEEFCREWNDFASSQEQESGDRAASMNFGFVRSAQPVHAQYSGSFPVMPFLVVALLGFLFVAMSDRPSTTQPVQQVEVMQ